MKLESVDLTEGKGLTATSANYLANLAKEILKGDERSLKHLSFINTDIELINGDKKRYQSGRTSTEDIPALIHKIGELHSFIAWVREGIKAKDTLSQMVDNYTIQEYCADCGIEYSDLPNEQRCSETTVVAEMDIKERNRYLMLEAFSAAYGQYVHPDGAFSDARDDMLDKINNPTKLMGNGRDTIIYSYTRSLPTTEVEATFLELQSKYRDYEKQLNALKFKIKEEVNRRNTQYINEYKTACEEYAAKIKEIRNDFNKHVISLNEYVKSLKIVIPKELQTIFDYLESLG